jgi:hypothetical protein
MRTIVPVLIMAAGALAAASADARDVFRCSGSIIDTGLTIPEVLARCGEPESRDVSTVPIRARNRYGASFVVGAATLEYWVYQRRGGEFPVFLTFDEGRLRSIEFLTRR